jgi:hypothetical protein
VAYRLSERLNQDKKTPWEDGVDLGKVASVFIIMGILSLITAEVFSWETQKIFSDTVRPHVSYPLVPTQQAIAGQDEEGKDVATIGPISVQKYREVYSITISSNLPVNSWTFVVGEVLDAEKDYLFSFGKELWHETGYDSDGAWRETDNSYSMKVTFPQPGQYYLNIKTEGSYNPDAIRITISKRYGSSIPHTVFGIITLLIGLVLNEIRNKTLTKLAMRMSDD